MAQHETRKNTEQGKRETLSRRARRAARFHAPPADLKRLREEIQAEQRERRDRP